MRYFKHKESKEIYRENELQEVWKCEKCDKFFSNNEGWMEIHGFDNGKYICDKCRKKLEKKTVKIEKWLCKSRNGCFPYEGDKEQISKIELYGWEKIKKLDEYEVDI